MNMKSEETRGERGKKKKKTKTQGKRVHVLLFGEEKNQNNTGYGTCRESFAMWYVTKP